MLLGLVVVSIIAATLFTLYVKNDANNTLLLAIILAPAFFYWLGDKVPVEFGMGQFRAKFDKALERPTQTVLGDKIDSSAILSLSDQVGHLTESFRRATAPPEGTCLDYLVLRPSLVPQFPNPEYNRYMVYATHSIRNAIACGKLVGVVVVDDDEKYLGSYDSNFFAESLSSWGVFKSNRLATGMTEKEFAEVATLIESNTIFGAALRYPDRRIREGEGYFAFVRTTDSLKYAWRQFHTMAGSFVAVTDRELRFKGILTRSTIQNLVLSELVARSPAQNHTAQSKAQSKPTQGRRSAHLFQSRELIALP